MATKQPPGLRAAKCCARCAYGFGSPGHRGAYLHYCDHPATGGLDDDSPVVSRGQVCNEFAPQRTVPGVRFVVEQTTQNTTGE